MEADQTQPEGMYGVVYGEEISPITNESEFSSCIFPNIVVLDEAFSSSIFGGFEAVDSGVWFDGMVDLSSSDFTFESWSGEPLSITYTSSDGITYTRTDGGEELQDFGLQIKWNNSATWNNVIGNFMQISINVYDGLYQYNMYNDKERIKFMPLSSITIAGSGSSTTFTWDETYDNAVYNIRTIREIVNEMWPLEYGSSNLYAYLTIDSSDNIVLLVGRRATVTTSIYSSNMRCLYNSSTQNYAISDLSTYDLVLDIWEIDVENHTYTKQTTLEPSTKISQTQIFNFSYKMYPIVLNYNDTSSNRYYSGSFSMNLLYNNTIYSKSLSNTPNWEQPNNTEYLKWLIAPTQFTLVNSSSLEKDIVALGKSGVVTGTLGETSAIANTFDDFSAEVYGNVLNYYNTLTPRVLQTGDSFNGSNIKVVPAKSDGTSLIDTSNLTSCSGLFGNCSNLLYVTSLDTSNATTTSGMFYEDSKLCYVGDLDTSGVTNISTMFAGCENLKSIPSMDTTNVTDMTMAFSHCKLITSLPSLNTGNVTNMRSMLYDCVNLTTLPSLNTSSVTDMESMLSGCTNLTTLPLLDTSSVTQISAFCRGCYNFTTQSLNNLLKMCADSQVASTVKTLKYVFGYDSSISTYYPANTVQGLSNYQDFIDAGWTLGYE